MEHCKSWPVIEIEPFLYKLGYDLVGAQKQKISTKGGEVNQIAMTFDEGLESQPFLFAREIELDSSYECQYFIKDYA